MSKINEITNKVRETASEAKEVVVDNLNVIIPVGVAFGFLVGGIALSKHTSKKYEKLWWAAKEANESGNLDHDFGPYKVMKFFEPKTGEFIGETVCHESCMKAFLDLK